MSSAKIENFNDFRTELLKRFFNPKSYFFLSLSTQLQNISSISEDVTDDDYLIIGQIVQHFIDSDDPESKLILLNKLDRFNLFLRKLDEGLRHLHQPGLAPEEMKDTIERLANDLVHAMVDVIHSDSVGKQLLEILNISLPKNFQFGVSDSASEESKSASSIEWGENEMADDTLQQSDDPENVSQTVIAETMPEIIENSESDLQNVVNGPDTNSSSNIPEDREYECENPDPHEPFGLNVGFYQEAKATINKIKSIIEQLQPGEVPRKELKTLKTVFLDLRESAMVHGFGELEEISHKSQKCIVSLLKESLILPEAVVQLFQELPGIVKCALSEKFEAEEVSTLQTFAERLTQALAKPKEIEKEDGSPAETEIKVASEQFSESEENLVSDILDETLSEHFVEEIPQQQDDDLNLYLPGEDDPELLDLINEVTNKTEMYGTQDEGEDEPLFVHKQNVELHDINVHSTVLTPAAAPVSAKDNRMVNFRREADLYFRVVDEAIEQLLLNRQTRIAFENLELAAYSLKGLARKLGLEPLAKLPELVEELIGKIILLRISPGKDTYLTIKKAFTLLKKTADINEVEKREYRELDRSLLGLIRSLDEIESTQNDSEASDFSNSKETQNLNGMRQGNFQLRGRNSFPN